jgi:radical SAM superfamily enzyme YgiQ (UPF0313 family)
MPPIRFLLVNPTSDYWRARAPGRYRGARTFRFSMLTSLYVAASLPKGVETRIVDEDVEPLDYDTEADLVGVSFMTFNAPRAYAIADEFRRRGKPVVFGGYHPTFLPDEAIQHADAVCVGEAEATVPQLMADFRNGGLRRFYRGWPADLRGLAVPDRSLLRRSAYACDTVQATRGCPFSCTFCSVAAFHRQRFRTRPVDEVLDELRGVGRWLLFADDNIVGNRDYACELFARMAPLGKRWVSQCGIGAASDPEMLRLLRESGCVGLFIGFESLSEANLRASAKTMGRAADYERAIARIHEAGIGVFAGFVFGMDDDGPEVFRTTLDFLDRTRIDALQGTVLTPFPGTPLFTEMERQGRIRTRDWSQYDFGHVVFEPKGMSAQTLLQGQNWVLSRFYSAGQTCRRIARAFGYLPPSVILRAMAPMNVGYRLRHRAFGTYEKARGFEESAYSRPLTRYSSVRNLTCE